MANLRFEWFIGLRYLYTGKRERWALIGALTGVVMAVAGLALLATSGGSSPVGVVLLLVGMIGAVMLGMWSFLSASIAVAVLGVVLGVAALTVVLSVTTGFQDAFRDKVLGVNAHVIIMKSSTDFDDYKSVMDVARTIDKDVIAVQPFIFVEMLATTGKGQISGVAIKGVDPHLVTSVLDLQRHMLPGGSVDSLAHEPGPGELPPIIVGRELAHKLRLKVGDDVTVVVPLSNVDWNTWKTTAAAPRSRQFHVTGIFYSGFDEYDRRLMYTSLKECQALLERGDRVMGVELKVKDVDRAPAIADKLRKKLGEPPFQIQDWNQLNHNLFQALSTQKQVLLVVLTLIIAVATVNMVSALTMTVTEKVREIAILKSMGTSSTRIGVVFGIVGGAIGAIGTLCGIGIGVTTCTVVRNYGYRLDPRVYLIDRLPISVHLGEVALVAAVTMALCLAATMIPTLKAARLPPVEGLRSE
ncbi:MAG TPA: ABC transporter permease [Kofleriaceae bacterium]|nr:ABC transporter permease [Kofleriaceae bacterium]